MIIAQLAKHFCTDCMDKKKLGCGKKWTTSVIYTCSVVLQLMLPHAVADLGPTT
jgi:hypothetical protein